LKSAIGHPGAALQAVVWAADGAAVAAAYRTRGGASHIDGPLLPMPGEISLRKANSARRWGTCQTERPDTTCCSNRSAPMAATVMALPPHRTAPIPRPARPNRMTRDEREACQRALSESIGELNSAVRRLSDYPTVCTASPTILATILPSLFARPYGSAPRDPLDEFTESRVASKNFQKD